KFRTEHVAFMLTAGRVGMDLNTGRQLHSRLKQFQIAFGRGDEEQLLLNLATAAILQNDRAEAARLLREKDKVSEMWDGMGAPKESLTLSQDAAVRSALSLLNGDTRTAERFCRQALAQDRSIWPPKHPLLCASLNNLALTCFANQK